MFGRLGMYYLMQQPPSDRLGQPERSAQSRPIAIPASQTADLGLFLRLAGVIAVIAIAISLVGLNAG